MRPAHKEVEFMIFIVLPDVAADDNLLSRARNKDRDAQRAIYERYFPPVFQFIRLRIDNREQAQDIAADVFLDFFEALGGSKPPSSHLRGWLFRVARNKIVDHYGREKRMNITELGDWIPGAVDSNPEQVAFQTLQGEQVKRALNMLVDEQQEVLILRFIQGLSIQETADLMDRSVSAIKSLQFRAVDTLRRVLSVGDPE